MSSPSQRYEVVERLDAGGMAEVFRGKATSIEGFEKQVAIKRVLPHLAKNQKFVNMFLDEAKLSLYLDHANIVSVFDLGRAGHTYFIVMEYIDGPNLKKVIEWFTRQGEFLPVELAAYIVIEMCKGLEYAHNKADPAGVPLHIVHRDISPPNVLVSRDGEVKLTDFGLAKAQSQIEVTDPGVVKGKFGYLSPEAAHGHQVDLRTDVFAVGIVLWELLAGRRLFQGKNDLETLQFVRDADIPRLREFQAGVPRELEDIARKALDQSPDRRYSSAREMGTAVSRFLARHGLAVTSYDLANVVKRVAENDTTPPEQAEQRKVMSTVIQDEINKLIRIEADEPSMAKNIGGMLEDPRTWADFGFDFEPPAESVATDREAESVGAYAARGSDAQQPVVASSRTRVLTAAAGAPQAPSLHAPGAGPGAASLAPAPGLGGPPPPPHAMQAPNTPPPMARGGTPGPQSGAQPSPGIQDASGLRRRTPPANPVVQQRQAEAAAARDAEAKNKRVTLMLSFLVLVVIGVVAYLVLGGAV